MPHMINNTNNPLAAAIACPTTSKHVDNLRNNVTDFLKYSWYVDGDCFIVRAFIIPVMANKGGSKFSFGISKDSSSSSKQVVYFSKLLWWALIISIVMDLSMLNHPQVRTGWGFDLTSNQFPRPAAEFGDQIAHILR